MGIWDDLQKRIKFSLQDEHRTPSPRHLDRWEAENEFKLPRSYREFVLLFGPGSIGDEFRIKSPGFSKEGRFGFDLSPKNGMWFNTAGDERLAESWDEVSLVRRLLPFCSLEVADSGALFCWDTADITVPEDHEYRIHMLAGDFREVRRIARTFREFIVEVVLGSGYNRLVLQNLSEGPGEWTTSERIGFGQPTLEVDED